MEPLRLYVYGTLKRGQRNHDRFCQGAVDIQEAQVRGRLYEGPGFPVLEVPEDDILAIGTSMPFADLVTQQRFSDRLRPASGSNQGIDTSDAWDTIYGELIAFDDPVDRLPDLDYLEGYCPGEQSLFKRVLIPVKVIGAQEVVWIYAIEKLDIGSCRIDSGTWTA